MRTTFTLALLCLIFTSCQKDIQLNPSKQIETRTSLPLSVSYFSANGNETKISCLKIKCTAINSNSMALDLYSSTTNYYTVTAASVMFYNANGYTICTNESGKTFDEITNASIVPASINFVKLIVNSTELGNSNSFVGEESDGF